MVAGVAVGYWVLPMILGTAAGLDQDTFCVQNDADIDVNSASSVILPNLNITFSTQTGDSVLFSYTCHYRILVTDPGDLGGTYVYIVIDGVADPTSEIQVIGNYSSDDGYHSTIVLRHLKMLSAGSHNVSVQFSRFAVANTQLASQNVLSVQIL